MEESFELLVNKQNKFEFKSTKSSSLDFIQKNDGTFHILKNNKSYQVELVQFDKEEKIFTLLVNGNTYEVEIADKFDLLVKELGLSVVSIQKFNEVKAPMPGLVLEMNVKVGQEIKKGDGLLILEAMKMENVIKAIGEGIVKTIHVEKGNAVEKGALLIEMV